MAEDNKEEIIKLGATTSSDPSDKYSDLFDFLQEPEDKIEDKLNEVLEKERKWRETKARRHEMDFGPPPHATAILSKMKPLHLGISRDVVGVTGMDTNLHLGLIKEEQLSNPGTSSKMRPSDQQDWQKRVIMNQFREVLSSLVSPISRNTYDQSLIDMNSSLKSSIRVSMMAPLLFLDKEQKPLSKYENILKKKKTKSETLRHDDICFRPTADGGLIPVFDEDDEEYIIQQEDKETMGLNSQAILDCPSTSFEVTEAFPQCSSSKSSKVQRTRYLAMIRQRKYRTKLKSGGQLSAENPESAYSVQSPKTIVGQQEQSISLTHIAEACPIYKRYLAMMRKRKQRALMSEEKKKEIRRKETIKSRLKRWKTVVGTEDVLSGNIRLKIEAPLQVPVSVAPTIKTQSVQEEQEFPLRSTKVYNRSVQPIQSACIGDPKKRRVEIQRQRRIMMTEEEKEKIRIQNRNRQRALRERRKQEAMANNASKEQIKLYLENKAKVAAYARQRRAAMNDEERARERERSTLMARERRQRLSEGQRQMRRERDAAAQRSRRQAIYAVETEEQKVERRQLEAERMRQFRAKKSSQLIYEEGFEGNPVNSSESLSIECDDDGINPGDVLMMIAKKVDQ